MGNDSSKKYVCNVSNLIKLKDGRMACSYHASYHYGYVIEIFSINNLKTELIIPIYINLKEFIQLKNGKLLISSNDLRENHNAHTLSIAGVIFISFNNNSYNIEQKINCGYGINEPLKIMEVLDYIFYFGSKGLILIFVKINEKYIIFKKIQIYCNCYDFIYDFINAFNLENNNEMICLYQKSIKFFDLKEFKFVYEINNLNNKIYIKGKNSIIQINKNIAIVEYTNKYYIIDIINHQIISKMTFGKNYEIITIKKLLNNKIIIQFVEIDSNYKWLNTCLVIYKFEKYRLKKIKELNLMKEVAHFIEYDKDTLIAYVQEKSILYGSTTYIEKINIDDFSSFVE